MTHPPTGVECIAASVAREGLNKKCNLIIVGCAIVAVRERRPTGIAALAAVAIFSIGYSHILACGAQPAVMMMMLMVMLMGLGTHSDT